MAERKSKTREFEVLVSFDGLNAGERFSQDGDDLGWATQHVENGYLRDVTSEPAVTEAQGQQAPTAAPERVEEAKSAGEVGQG